MTGRKILIEQMPNPTNLTVHTNFKLETPVHGPHFMHPLREDKEELDALTPELQKLVRQLMAVEGVDGVLLYSYEVPMEKGVLFDFYQLAQQIARVFTDVFGEDGELAVEIRSQQPARPSTPSTVTGRPQRGGRMSDRLLG